LRARLVHCFDDVDGAVVVHRIEEVVPLSAHLNGRQHLGRQVVDHVVRADPRRLDGCPIGHVAMDEAYLPVVRQIAFYDVGHDHLLAVSQKLGCKMAADEAVAAEDDVLHRMIDLSVSIAFAAIEVSSALRPLWAMSTVPAQMSAMPAMR